mgnify:CR=1 FL=1
MKNLWPKIEPENLSYPVNLLRQQGKFLEKMTNGTLTYSIDTKILESFRDDESETDTEIEKSFRTDFYIRAPHISEYKFLLLYITHDFTHIYPLSVGDFYTKGVRYAHNQREFETALEEVLRNPTTQNVINNLYAKSGSLNPALGRKKSRIDNA